MAFKTDKKFLFIKTQLGSRQDYSTTIKQGSFTNSEIDILLQASATVNGSQPNKELIYKAYNILHSKNIYKETKSTVKPSAIRPNTIKDKRLMKCPNCKKSILKNANSCPNCKLVLDTEKNKYLVSCYKCGTKVYATEKKCPNCDASLQKFKNVAIFSLIILIGYILINALNK